MYEKEPRTQRLSVRQILKIAETRSKRLNLVSHAPVPQKQKLELEFGTWSREFDTIKYRES